MAKKKNLAPTLPLTELGESRCNRTISVNQYCQTPREHQACYPVPCNDEYNAHAFITPCEECNKTIKKRLAFMPTNEFNEWAKEKWSLVIQTAANKTAEQHKPKARGRKT